MGGLQSKKGNGGSGQRIGESQASLVNNELRSFHFYCRVLVKATNRAAGTHGLGVIQKKGLSEKM